MFKERSSLIINGHRFLDILITISSFIGAYFIKKYALPAPYGGLSQDPNYYTILFMTIILWYLSFNLFDIYRSYRNQTLGQVIWDAVKAVLAGFVFLNLLMYILRFPHVSRMLISIFVLLNILLLSFSKTLIFQLVNYSRKRTYNIKNIVIIGSREGTKVFINNVMKGLGVEYRILGCLETDQCELDEKTEDCVEVIGHLESLEDILRKHVIDEIIFTISLREIIRYEKYIALAEEMGINIRFLPEWYIQNFGFNPIIGSLHMQDFFGIPTLTLITTPHKYGALFIKNVIDHALGTIMFVLLLPLFTIITIAIKISSKGPAIFKQERVGLNGRKFTFLKFRTMTSDAEEQRKLIEDLNEADGPVFKIKNDPRIIPFIGRLLRRTNMDELPQLLNVIKGEMSLVGPRPPLPNEVEKYDVWERRRLSMKPGMTCLWQITKNRNEMNFKEWMDLDLRYIDHWSLMLDFKILLKTFWVTLRCTGR